MAHLTNFSFQFFNKIFTEDASLPLLYHGAKKSKMTKNSNQGGSCLKLISKKSVPARFLESLQKSYPVSSVGCAEFPRSYYRRSFAFATTARKARVDALEACIALFAAFTTRITHHPSMSIPTVFLRTNSLPSTAFLTLPSPSLSPPLDIPPTVTAIAPMRAHRERRPNHASNEAADHLVNLIYAPS